MTDIGQYFQFIMKLIFGFGIAFQVPVLTFLLVRTGMVSKQSFKKSAPFVIILFFIIASLLTPPDVLSQIFLAIPMWILFEIGLFLSSRKNNYFLTLQSKSIFPALPQWATHEKEFCRLH